MKKQGISIKTMASDLNISTTTVSFVLNGKAKEKHISPELTKKVLDYAKKVNYKPNLIAQSLRTGKSHTLVLIVEDISNNFFARLARIIEDIAYSKGYKVIFCSHENNDQKFAELIEYFKFRMMDGYIIVPPAGSREAIEELSEQNVPIVLVDRLYENIQSNAVVIDNRQAAYSATKHLLNNGYKSTAFVTVDLEQTQMLDRLQGYEDAMEEKGLSPLVLNLPFAQAREQKGKNLIDSFMVKNSKIDSLFFATNYLTQSGLETPRIKNKLFARELGVVAFDDNDFFRIYHPSITAVAQPLQEIGAETMRLMLGALKRKNVQLGARKVILNAELMERESSQPSSSSVENNQN
ncbi:LacI family DNA-binding transcriptional regulator [Chryseobacterium sp. A301]